MNTIVEILSILPAAAGLCALIHGARGGTIAKLDPGETMYWAGAFMSLYAISAALTTATGIQAALVGVTGGLGLVISLERFREYVPEGWPAGYKGG